MSDTLVDNLISTVNRLEQRVSHLEETEPPTRWVFDPFDYGAVADGDSHPLSDYYGALADAQEVYAHAIDLTDEIDWCALQAAINAAADADGGGTVLVNGNFITNRPLLLPRENISMLGRGGSPYWSHPSSIQKITHTLGSSTNVTRWTGTHTGSDGVATLTDADVTPEFDDTDDRPCDPSDGIVWNLTQGWNGNVTSETANTLTIVGGGTWDTGDEWLIPQMYDVDSVISIDHPVSSTARARNMTLQGFVIRGPGRTDRATYGIYAPRMSEVRFVDLTIMDTGFSLFTYYAWLIYLERCKFQYCDAGLWVDRVNSSSTSFLVANCYVVHFDVTGYCFQRAGYCTCVGCAVDGDERTGIETSGGSNTVFTDANVRTNYNKVLSVSDGLVIINVDDKDGDIESWGVVTAVGETTITCAAGLAHGTANAWTVGDRAKIVKYRTGTHTGGNAVSILEDTSASPDFTDALLGQRIWNITDGSSGPITAVTPTTVTATLAGGTNTWDEDDVWQINIEAAGYRAQYGSELTISGGAAESLGTKVYADAGIGGLAAAQGPGVIVLSSAGDAGTAIDTGSGGGADTAKVLSLGSHTYRSKDPGVFWEQNDEAVGWEGDPENGYIQTAAGIEQDKTALLKRYFGPLGIAENIADDTFEDVLTFTCSDGSFSSDRGICSGALNLHINGKTSGGNQEFVSQRWHVTIYKLSTGNLQSDIQQIGSDNAYNNVGYTMTVQEQAGASATSLTVEAKILYASAFPSPSDVDMVWDWEFTSQATTATTFITPENAQ